MRGLHAPQLSGTLLFVGTWGTAIFSDDIALDVRSTYRAILESGATDADALRQVLAGYGSWDRVVWLALAAAQHTLGRLDSVVRDRALEIIDSGEDLEEWGDAGSRDHRARHAVLMKLRAKLTGEQPARKPIAVKWRHHTDLAVGDTLRIDTTFADSIFWVVVAVEPDPQFGTHRNLVGGVGNSCTARDESFRSSRRLRPLGGSIANDPYVWPDDAYNMLANGFDVPIPDGPVGASSSDITGWTFSDQGQPGAAHFPYSPGYGTANYMAFVSRTGGTASADSSQHAMLAVYDQGSTGTVDVDQLKLTWGGF